MPAQCLCPPRLPPVAHRVGRGVEAIWPTQRGQGEREERGTLAGYAQPLGALQPTCASHGTVCVCVWRVGEGRGGGWEEGGEEGGEKGGKREGRREGERREEPCV